MVKKLKRWLAAVLAVTFMMSFTVIGFSYTLSSPSKVYFLSSLCTYTDGTYQFEIDMASYFENHPTSDDEKQKILDSYNAYLSALEDSSKSILVQTAKRSSVDGASESVRIFICNKSELMLSVTSPYFRIDGDYHLLYFTPSLTTVSGSSGNVIRWSSPSGYKFFVKNPVYPPSTSDSNAIYVVGGSVNFHLNLTNLENPSVHTLTVNYFYTEDNPATDSFTQSLASGAEYSIPSPEIEGYTPDTPLVSGTMPDEDLTINVFYSRTFYPLTIKYQYADGRKASEDISFQYPLGFVYDVPSPEIEGYQPDKPTIAGEMPGEALEAVVTYTAIPYTLTVNYQYVGGGQAAPSYQEQLIIGSNYYVTSPVIEGYHPNQLAVSGVMPASDVVSTVTYREDSGGSSGPDPVGPGEGGDSGSGDSGEGGSSSGYDPFIPSLPPFSGKDPFVIPDMPEYSGYDPFKIVGPPAYSGYDPFIVPRIPAFSGYDPFAMPNKGDIE